MTFSNRLKRLVRSQPTIQEIIKTIAKTKVQNLIYISCNPQTLARDINRFQNKGYDFRKISAVDMFPQTMHVETVVLMSRN